MCLVDWQKALRRRHNMRVLGRREQQQLDGE